ncbi:alpha/beta hydrolase fold domain-containing protein [Candidatus Bathyarchaeota archaeon]|nr:alpha/beta hydrolase fold domain-containing protein [Candidatus Bathyarchaeota archaeon]
MGHLFPAPPPSLQITDKMINPDVTVRIFSPLTGTGGGQKLPIGVFYHGGGFAVGGLVEESPDPQHFAQYAGCTIVSVGYRLAPEVTYDQILKDAIAGYEWVSFYLSFPACLGGLDTRCGTFFFSIAGQIC